MQIEPDNIALWKHSDGKVRNYPPAEIIDTAWEPKVYHSSEVYIPRRKPRSLTRKRILNKQGNRCLYCRQRFGAEFIRTINGQKVKGVVILHWDHFIPYSYAEANPEDNWVASCASCNRIKHSKMFATLEEATLHIMRARKNKGYEI